MTALKDSLPDLDAEAGRAEHGSDRAGIQRGWVRSGFIPKPPGHQKCRVPPSRGALGPLCLRSPGQGRQGPLGAALPPAMGWERRGGAAGGCRSAPHPHTVLFGSISVTVPYTSTAAGRPAVADCFLRGLQREDPRARSPACFVYSCSLAFCATEGKRRG